MLIEFLPEENQLEYVVRLVEQSSLAVEVRNSARGLEPIGRVLHIADSNVKQTNLWKSCRWVHHRPEVGCHRGSLLWQGKALVGLVASNGEVTTNLRAV
jgi:hypothetical protein